VVKQQLFILHRWIDRFDLLWRVVIVFSLSIVILCTGALLTNIVGVPGQSIFLTQPETWRGEPIMWVAGALWFGIVFLGRVWYNAASPEEVEQAINGTKNART